MEHLSLKLVDNYPRDLLRRFIPNDADSPSLAVNPNPSPNVGSDSEDVELNLGLSLGGRFGVDRRSPVKLVRSSSVACMMTPTTTPDAAAGGLVRTSSLPPETEEEWRKRKELQMLSRMEAKRRRSEKQLIFGANNVGKLQREPQQQQHTAVAVAVAPPPFGFPAWALAGARSADSQGGSSSGMSDSESKPVQGSSGCGEARSPASNQSPQGQSNQKDLGTSATSADQSPCRSAEVDNPSKKLGHADSRGREIGMNAMVDMPGVFTKGDGPSGRRIDGILYKYGKEQEVKIMCVCHGSFLSPAEFVKHAGGTDLAHPLRHIVVNTASSSSSSFS